MSSASEVIKLDFEGKLRSRPRVDGSNQCGGVNDTGHVPVQLCYFEEAMTWPAVVGLLPPDEALDESLAAYAIQSEAVGTLKLPLHRPEPRRPHAGYAEIVPSELADLSGTVECARVNFV
jgi:hypothetical protein